MTAANWASRHYQTSRIFSAEEIGKIEAMRIGYGYLIKKLDRERKRDIFDRFTANFTYDSNAIEGSSLTLKDVAIIMFDKETVPNKPLREIYETRNSRAVVEMILKKKFMITHRDIIKMHSMLMKDIDTRKGYKKIPNVIFRTEKEVHTTPPEKVEKEMTSLLEWYNKSRLHPLERAAIFHGRFEKIHPFEDGNGRVGRFLSNVILVNNGYSPLIVRKTKRHAYMAALAAFDNGYEDKLKRFLLERFKDTYRKFFEIYVKYM
jgi:Fic family protein